MSKVRIIRDSESFEFEAAPGEKELFLKVDWCRSNKIKVVVPVDGVVIAE